MLNKKQEEGLITAIKRFKAGERYTTIAGYAGTGKSFLVRHIIEALAGEGLINPDKDVVYTAFTGKATQVLSQRGNKNCQTLHKLLYKSHLLPNGKYTRQKVGRVDYKLVIVDEVSMVPTKMLVQMLSYPIPHYIFLGDPFQLPPICQEENNGLLANAHIFLDEIMRQEAESDIIQLTMKIRNGEPIHYGKYNDVQIIPKAQLNTGMLEWADQVICATNSKRKELNKTIREMNGFHSSYPLDGDKLICYRNYWDITSTEDDALINGTIGYLQNSYESFSVLPAGHPCYGRHVPTLCGNLVIPGFGEYQNLEIDKEMTLTEEPTVSPKVQYVLSRKHLGFLVPLEFTFGYAITCHRAQGSQWDNVLVVEENFPFNKEEHARWLYTAATRPTSKLVIVR